MRRDGEEREIAPGDVVRDDILVLRAGDQVPADAVVADGRALQIDESMLTGESDAVDKNRGDEALSGSIVVAGPTATDGSSRTGHRAPEANESVQSSAIPKNPAMPCVCTDGSTSSRCLRSTSERTSMQNTA